VLVTALVFATIISVFAAGVGYVSASHNSRGAVEADYATAVQLADAGINFELRWLSEDAATAGTRAHQAYPSTGSNGAHTRTVPDIPGNGTFTVSVMNTDGTGPWRPPNGVMIRSTGTINGVSRTVEITGKKRSLFGEYAIFSIDEAALSGTKAFVIGNMGTNGPVRFSGGSPEMNVNGYLTFNGYPTSRELLGDAAGPNVWWNPDPVKWPTVDQIAGAAYPGGLNYIRTHNDNDRVKMFLDTDPQSLLENAVTVSIPTDVLEKRAFNNLSVSRNPQDRPGGNRYQNGMEGLYGNRTLIFPPGDYYFNGLKLGNGTGEAILIDNAKGMVRIWVDGGNAKDSFDLPVIFTSTDKNKFRLYYNNCNELTIGGNSQFFGGIYSKVDGCQSSLKFHGNSQVYGSIIFELIELSGNSDIVFPNDGGGEADSDWALWYGFMNTWREVKQPGGTLFPDGTTR
jgi:hypothetical protein